MPVGKFLETIFSVGTGDNERYQFLRKRGSSTRFVFPGFETDASVRLRFRVPPVVDQASETLRGLQSRDRPLSGGPHREVPRINTVGHWILTDLARKRIGKQLKPF